MCLSGTSYIDLGEIAQDLAEDQIGADPPPITLQPAAGIVNLPTIAFTDPRPPIEVDISDPVIGTITATPEFSWDFGDGAGGYGPGLPYDGTSPRENPGYYVAHAYTALGQRTVALTVTWRVTFTMPGYVPVPLDDVVREATAVTDVRLAGSELVGG